MTISFNLAPGVSLGEATEVVEQAVEELHMPASVQGSFQGTAQVFRASMSNTPILVAAALFAVYIVLGMLYESLIHPITIISTCPRPASARCWRSCSPASTCRWSRSSASSC